ncbi:MAG: hypothetical protein OXB88_08955 [Bacteriovoracales bacterium]|nr:hypothetical protein [Bacteriovoracales bacterium]
MRKVERRSRGQRPSQPSSLLPRKRSPGRPPKPPEQRVQLVSLKLSPELIGEIKDLPFGRGMGSRVRELLFYFKGQEKKEIARAKLLKKLLLPFDAHLCRYFKIIGEERDDPKARTLLKKLIQMSEHIQMIVEILHWGPSDIRDYLREDEAQTLQFALDFKKEMGENRSFRHVL